VIWPENENDPDLRPIVIFTDGLAFHKDRLEKDFMQRMAILSSQGFWVWNLTWEDIDRALNDSPESAARDMLDSGVNESSLQAAYRGKDSKSWNFQAPSFDLLFRYLSERSQPDFAAAFAAHFVASVSKFPTKKASVLNVLKDYVDPNVVDAIEGRLSGSTFISYREWPLAKDRESTLEYSSLRILLANDSAAAKKGDISQALALLWMDDTPLRREKHQFKQDWAALLWALNRVQFVGQVFCLPSENQADMPFGKLLNRMTLPSGSAKVADQGPWNDVIELATMLSPAYGEKLASIRDAGISAPISGYELYANGRVVANAEAAWEAVKVALLPAQSEDPDGHEAAFRGFVGSGWEIFDILEVTVAELQELLGSLS